MEPKYNVGDIVTVKKEREGNKNDYRFAFTDEMIKKHGGKSYKINSRYNVYDEFKSTIPDDEHRYYLEGTSFMWASSMFEDSSETLVSEPSIDNSLDAFIAKKKCPKLDFTL